MGERKARAQGNSLEIRASWLPTLITAAARKDRSSKVYFEALNRYRLQD